MPGHLQGCVGPGYTVGSGVVAANHSLLSQMCVPTRVQASLFLDKLICTGCCTGGLGCRELLICL